jgi:hypothetical protein
VTQTFRVSLSGVGCRIPRPEQQAAIAALVPATGMRGSAALATYLTRRFARWVCSAHLCAHPPPSSISEPISIVDRCAQGP